MLLYSAIFVGLLGGLHCLGMCGPIALALPNAQNKALGWGFVRNRLLYNLGRILTYASLGAIVGLLGKGIALGGSQQWLSIGIGLLIITLMFLPKTWVRSLERQNPLPKFGFNLKKQFGKLFGQDKPHRFLLIGIFNGFLPCGLVYLALAGAIATGEVLDGMLYMALFGLGTVPVMLGVSFLGNFISPKQRSQLYRRLMPVFAFSLALMFILRGLNLGIPYLSPKITAQNDGNVQVECCHPSEAK